MAARRVVQEAGQKAERTDQTITFAKIFPPIGIARVGDSESEFFFGPEFSPGSARPAIQRFRDDHGRIKRQAARFRIYGFNAGGHVVREITAKNAEVTWSARLANKKSAWFEFNGAAAARRQFANTAGEETRSPQRNSGVGSIVRDKATGRFGSDADRKMLEIDGGTKNISGANIASSDPDDRYQFKGFFKRGSKGEGGHEVYLGELRTDDAGRLVVLGGRGASLPVDSKGPVEGDDRLKYWIVNYANNDAWCDDTSDGPVTATVVLDGKKIPVEGGAWVVVAPPDFAPDVSNLVTLYDVMEEAAIAARMSSRPGTSKLRDLKSVSFHQDILPILNRVNDYRWVSPLGLRGHGLAKPGDTGGSVGAMLQRRDDRGLKERERFMSVLRVPTYPGLDPATGKEAKIDEALAVAQATTFFMPPLSGDEGDRSPGRPQNWFSLTRLQYGRMDIWRRGLDVDSEGPQPVELKLADEPAQLTESAMTACAGGAFFPGIEMTSVVRDPSLYVEPFRIDHKRVGPGDMTKFMACPWQADFYECRDAWWPAQRPDTVITDLTFEELFSSFEAERGKVEGLMFRRERWDRGLERKPRPSRDYLMGLLLPDPADGDASAYAEAVAQTATDVLFGLTRARTYMRFATTPVTSAAAERLPSPWRLQYLMQEQLDGYSGRYFLPTVPGPDGVLQSLQVPAAFKPPTPAPTLESIRHDWTALRVNHPGYAGFLLATYVTAAKAALEAYLKLVVLQTPEPADGGLTVPPLTPARRLQFNLQNASDNPSSEPGEFEASSASFCRLRGGEFVTQLISGLFLSSCGEAPDMAMVDQWRSLGFVRTRTIAATKDTPAVTVQIETERSKYAGKSFRDYFYYLMNISEFSDFEVFAKTIVDDVLKSAQKLIDQTSLFDPNHPESFVPYSPANFAAKMEQIYELLRAQANQKPAYNYQNTRQDRIRALTGNAPFNQVDGA